LGGRVASLLIFELVCHMSSWTIQVNSRTHLPKTLKSSLFLSTDAGEPCAVATIDPFAALDAFTSMGSGLTHALRSRSWL
jgi:hypothetical protein